MTRVRFAPWMRSRHSSRRRPAVERRSSASWCRAHRSAAGRRGRRQPSIRVVAIAPAVIDMLNVEPSFIHHWQAYGAWSDAVKLRRSADHGLDGDEEFRALMKIEEPYAYRERLTLPKYAQRVGRSVLLAGFLAVLLQRPGGEISALRAERIAFAREDRRARESASVLCDRGQEHAAAADRVDVRNRRLDQGRREDRPDDVRVWQATNPEAHLPVTM